ncbi:Ig domain-containing protein [Micromonospora craterilacus]|uniref:Ig domain-containing protein n=1 Tax=Micromonospora craterilacus TaxID=1655439 RepID=UPI001F23E97C|nr:Ig domain-containing protein [Micromonospora craterilacus]
MIVSVLMVLLLGSAQPAAAATVTVTSGPPDSPVTAYESYPTHTFTASGGTAPYSLSLRSGSLPVGMALSSSGTFSGTPTTPGSYTFGIRMTDAGGEFADQSVTVVVVAPTITVTSDAPTSPWYTGQPYPTHKFTASGGTAPYSLSLRSGSLPVGMALSSSGTFSGTPTTPGSYSFGIRLSDKNGFHVDQDVTVVIAAPATVITSGEPPRGTVGKAYSFRFTAEGDSEIKFSVTAGDLPPGLTLAPDGQLSGTPGTAGTFAFTVTAAGTATSATDEVSLVVGAAPSSPSPTPTQPTPTPTVTPTDPAPTPTDSAEPTPTTPAPASPSPSKTTGAWLPVTGSNSTLVLMLLAVVAFCVGGILFVMAYERRRRFTTPE